MHRDTGILCRPQRSCPSHGLAPAERERGHWHWHHDAAGKVYFCTQDSIIFLVTGAVESLMASVPFSCAPCKV